MKTFRVNHFIPADEVGMHEPQVDCSCESFVVTSDRLEGTAWFGTTCYEHVPYSPLDVSDKNGWNGFTVL